MTFRAKLMLASSAAVAGAASLVTFIVATATQHTFERLDVARAQGVVAQFQREFRQRSEEVASRARRIASMQAVNDIALELNKPDPDRSSFVDQAAAIASAQSLPFVELVSSDGSILSSAQWPARFGYPDEWVVEVAASGERQAYLRREQLPDETALGLVAVATATAGDAKVHVAAGERLDRDFLISLQGPPGTQVLLYQGGPQYPTALRSYAGLLRGVERTSREATAMAGESSAYAMPLLGRNGEFLGALVVLSSAREARELRQYILWLGLGVGAGGILLGCLFAVWATARVTQPVNQLVEAADEVSRGNWAVHVPAGSGDELGRLAESFNHMTAQLIGQREQLIQTERVAAWRELARRLAHELKNPLFPLQITVENMRRARESHPEQFDEVFREGSQALLAELANLKEIVGRFSDFARMPAPEFRDVRVNEIVSQVVRLLAPQAEAGGVRLDAELDPEPLVIQADGEQMQRLLRNLVLNALDATGSGGRILVRTVRREDGVRLEVSDTGAGLTPEEQQRLFTPYYTTKRHGTGLGLAIVQSVVSDHGGRISVESQVGKGTTFRVDLSAKR